MNEAKVKEFTMKFSAALADVSNIDSENYISPDDMEEFGTEMFHAMATMAPCMIYNRICQDDVDILTFNHICNRLIVQSK